MPKLEATTTVTTVVQLSPLLKRKLLTEFKVYATLKAQQNALQAQLDASKAKIHGFREQSGEKALTIDGFKTTLVEPVRAQLDKKKFVELGGSLEMLENATVSKPTKAYEKITLPGDVEKDY